MFKLITNDQAQPGCKTSAAKDKHKLIRILIGSRPQPGHPIKAFVIVPFIAKGEGEIVKIVYPDPFGSLLQAVLAQKTVVHAAEKAFVEIAFQADIESYERIVANAFLACIIPFSKESLIATIETYGGVDRDQLVLNLSSYSYHAPYIGVVSQTDIHRRFDLRHGLQTEKQSEGHDDQKPLFEMVCFHTRYHLKFWQNYFIITLVKGVSDTLRGFVPYFPGMSVSIQLGVNAIAFI